MSAPKCARPCAGCPWRRENQTPEAIAQSPRDGAGVHWFSTKNLAKHWKAITTVGAMLPCHETDDHADRYGGTAAKNGKGAHICVGVSVLAHREMYRFMVAGTDVTQYKRAGGTFTPTALAAWASRFNYVGAVFELDGRKFKMPRVDDNESVALPEGL